jgi:hypothetical protein
LLSGVTRRLVRDVGAFRILHRLARSGSPVRAEVIQAVPLLSGLAVADPDQIRPPEVRIGYLATLSGNSSFEGEATLRFVDLAEARLPRAGTKIAVWYSPKDGALLI